VFYTWYVLFVSSGLAHKIRSARTGSQLSQEALARELGINPRTVQTWERRVDPVEPRIEHLRRLAFRTGKPLAWFLEDEDEQVEENGAAA
jgi:transcriptional regulator with XRE-family HTH domain